MLLFSSLTPTAIDYNPNVSATMQQPSSVVYANHVCSVSGVLSVCSVSDVLSVCSVSSVSMVFSVSAVSLVFSVSAVFLVFPVSAVSLHCKNKRVTFNRYRVTTVVA